MNIDREGRLDFTEVKYVEGEVSRELQNGDVLFNNTNSPDLVGKTAAVLVEARLAYSNHMTRIRLEDGLNPIFVASQLHYLWMSGYFRHRCVNHVNQASISTDPLSETVPVLIAPAREQERIADALDELLSDLDAGVAALERAREKLKLYGASVLKSAVEGVLTAEWRAQHPHTEPADKLLKRILAEHRRRWEEDELARFKGKGQEPPRNWRTKYREPVSVDPAKLSALPEGWCWATLDQLTVLITKGTSPGWQGFQYQASGIPFVRSQNVRWGTLDLTSIEHLPQGFNESHAGSIVWSGDVLLNLVGASVGRCAIADNRVHGANVNQAVGIIRLVSSEIVNQWIVIYVISYQGQGHIHATKADVARANFNLDDIRLMPVPILPSGEQEAIVEVVEGQLSVIDHLEADLLARLKSAQGLRQAVLRHAFAGQLVPQDPNDEPASELLKSIAAAREARARDAGVRRTATAINTARSLRRRRPNKTKDR